MMTGLLPAAESAEARYDPRLYVRISRDLREKRAAGVIAAGDAVRVTSLMQEWSTSRQTVRKALHVLEAEGLIRRYPGVGYFVPSRTDTGQATCRNGSAS
jgi:DNA-binding GntR family transcriptional regulator